MQAPPALRPSLTRLLRRTAVVEDLAAARALVAADPTVVAVTRDGDVLGAGFAYGRVGDRAVACSRCRPPSTRRRTG